MIKGGVLFYLVYKQTKNKYVRRKEERKKEERKKENKYNGEKKRDNYTSIVYHYRVFFTYYIISDVFCALHYVFCIQVSVDLEYNYEDHCK